MITKRIIRLTTVLILLLSLGQAAAAQPNPEQARTLAGLTERDSVSYNWIDADGASGMPSLATYANILAFDSLATNLVMTDTNEVRDVFVFNRTNGIATLVSVASDGTQGNAKSEYPAISGDGRYVAYASDASNLVIPDTNGVPDVFLYDLVTMETIMVSVATGGAQGNAMSLDASISSDGRYVAFTSYADNLVADDTNGYEDVFLYDRVEGDTIRVSVASNGTQGNSWSEYASISADGNLVAFASDSANLVNNDNNTYVDIFVHDISTGETSLVSVSSQGDQANYGSEGPSISADGRYVAFQTQATNLVEGDTNAMADIFLHDRSTGETTRASVASGGGQSDMDSAYASLSADGAYVAFTSAADNLVNGDTNMAWDVFVHDVLQDKTWRVSVHTSGEQGNLNSMYPSISADGHFTAFQSDASNLIDNDNNDVSDVFLHYEGPIFQYQFLPMLLRE